jgi:hypothetical protein
MRCRATLLRVALILLSFAFSLGYAEGPGIHGLTAPSQERAACGIHCGTERWSVKTLTDADRNKVNLTPKETTVGWLVSQQSPASLPADRRVAPVESQTYKVRALLVEYKLEADEDFHIVIADVEDPCKTMIAEIPSPDCDGACASGHAEEFREARAVILGLGDQVRPVTLVVTGVGFFDFLHGQTGAAPSGIELHPVLKIELEPGSGAPSVPVPAPQAGPENAKREVKVWVNTASGVYHCPGTRWYGVTKSGTYMAQTEAQQDGYRPAYGKVCQSGASADTSATPSQQEKTAPTLPQHAGNPDVRVWVNTGSGVYHCPGTRWYGNTKQGEYMTQGQAQNASYRPAYGKVCE